VAGFEGEIWRKVKTKKIYREGVGSISLDFKKKKKRKVFGTPTGGCINCVAL